MCSKDWTQSLVYDIKSSANFTLKVIEHTFQKSFVYSAQFIINNMSLPCFFFYWIFSGVQRNVKRCKKLNCKIDLAGEFTKLGFENSLKSCFTLRENNLISVIKTLLL